MSETTGKLGCAWVSVWVGAWVVNGVSCVKAKLICVLIDYSFTLLAKLPWELDTNGLAYVYISLIYFDM